MALANDAAVHDGEIVGDPTEAALVVLAAKGGLDVDETRRVFPRVGEVPFDSDYKFMATFHEMDEDGRKVVRCFVKGAPDVLLARSSHVRDVDGAARPAGRWRESSCSPRTTGSRARGFACWRSPRASSIPSASDAEEPLLDEVQGLTLLALVGIVDPPRKEARDAIARCKEAGIRARMITGDHATTAAAIAAQLGIEGTAMSGTEFAALTDEELDAQVDEIGVVARVAPEDKVRLVDMLKTNGNVVAMTGDGVNDAPALKRADIGVAMGITGTEVTKEAGDMILTDDNFATIVSAVEGGRGDLRQPDEVRARPDDHAGRIHPHSSSAGIFDVADGSPLTPLQILWINFAIDVLLAIGLGFDARGSRADAAHSAGRECADRRSRRRDPARRRGVLMAMLALVVVAWGEHRYDLVVATTMGLTTLSLMHIVARAGSPRADGDDLQALHRREPAIRAADRRRARAHVPRHDALAAAADLRHGLADELAVGHLPARPDRLPGGRRARQAGRARRRRFATRLPFPPGRTSVHDRGRPAAAVHVAAA